MLFDISDDLFLTKLKIDYSVDRYAKILYIVSWKC